MEIKITIPESILTEFMVYRAVCDISDKSKLDFSDKIEEYEEELIGLIVDEFSEPIFEKINLTLIKQRNEMMKDE